MPSIKTRDLAERDFKERGKASVKKKVVQTRGLSNKQINKARDQENESDETETDSE